MDRKAAKRYCHQNDNGKDFISNLPDCVLAHILSKLPTKYAVATAILSTRWKNLFSLIPYPKLDFDDSLILDPKNDGDDESSVEKRVIHFSRFVYRVLDVMLKEVPVISRFTLKCGEEYEDEQILDWIYAALQRSVLILDIDICMDDAELFFQLISDWTSLWYLALRNYLSIYIPSSFALPNLEHLVLDGIQFFDNDAIPLLLSGCPILKRLTMRYCHLEEVDVVNISVPSLTHLSIQYCFYSIATAYYRVMLDTPALEELYYKDYVAGEVFLKNLNSIRDVHVSVLPIDKVDKFHTLQYNQHAASLVRACCKAKTLHLSTYTISAFEISNEPVPRFCNLTALQLGGLDLNGWKVLPMLLENAPKLELLSIAGGFYEEKGCFEIFKSQMPDKVPTCLLSNLKKIEIFELEGGIDELHLIQFFLDVGKVLNKIEITCELPWKEYILLGELLGAYAAEFSDTCQIFLRNIK